MDGYVRINFENFPNMIFRCQMEIKRCLEEQEKDNERIVEHFQNIFNNAPKRNKFSLWWNKNVMFKWHKEQRNNWTKEEVKEYLIKNFYDDYIEYGFKCHVLDMAIDNFPFESKKKRIQWLNQAIKLFEKVQSSPKLVPEDVYLSIKDYMSIKDYRTL